jgi:hypothetical protein
MKKNEFNKASISRLETCYESIVKVVKEAAKCTPIGFDIVSGAMSIDELRMLYKKRKVSINPDAYIEAELKTKVKYKKELYAKVPALLEKKKDKSRGISINCPGGSDEQLCMVVGNILGTANRVLKDECLLLTGITNKAANFELISK